MQEERSISAEKSDTRNLAPKLTQQDIIPTLGKADKSKITNSQLPEQRAGTDHFTEHQLTVYTDSSSSKQYHQDLLEEINLKIRYMKNDIEFKKQLMEKQSISNQKAEKLKKKSMLTNFGLSSRSEVRSRKLPQSEVQYSSFKLEKVPHTTSRHVMPRSQQVRNKPILSSVSSQKPFAPIGVSTFVTHGPYSGGGSHSSHRLVIPTQPSKVDKGVPVRTENRKVIINSQDSSSSQHSSHCQALRKNVHIKPKPLYLSPDKRTVIFSANSMATMAVVSSNNAGFSHKNIAHCDEVQKHKAAIVQNYHNLEVYESEAATSQKSQTVEKLTQEAVGQKIQVTSTQKPQEANVYTHHEAVVHKTQEAVLLKPQAAIVQKQRTVVVPKPQKPAVHKCEEVQVFKPGAAAVSRVSLEGSVKEAFPVSTVPSVKANRYKLVKTHNSVPSTSRIVIPPSSSQGITSSCDNPTNSKNAAGLSQKSSLSNRTTLLTSTGAGLPLMKKSPYLKVQTAAKLVSKYKMKRLSPTSASKVAPILYQGTPMTTKRTSNNKLDKRRIIEKSPSLSKLKRSFYKSQLDHCETQANSLTRKLDKRNPSENQKYKFISVQGREGQSISKLLSSKVNNSTRFKLDHRIKKGLKGTNKDVAKKSIHKLDRRSSAQKKRRPSGSKSTSQNSPYHWVRDSFPKKLIHLSEKRGASRSQFRWRQLAHKSDASRIWKAPGVEQRFKWSRLGMQGASASLHKDKMRRLLLKGQALARLKRLSAGSSREGVLSTTKGVRGGVSMVMIGGILYKSSTKKLTIARSLPAADSQADKKRKADVLAGASNLQAAASKKNAVFIRNLRREKMKLISVRGVHFHIDVNGKKLSRTDQGQSTSSDVRKANVSRLDIGGVTYVQTQPGTLERLTDDNTRLAASRAVHRSIAIAAAKFRKSNRSKVKKQHCMFFGRFGKCQRGDKCPFIHDPERVAVCTRFLRGKCTTSTCPFSHNASIHKMPVCLFYLRGSCVREKCPYLHVKVSPDAPVCKDFLNGYCGRGEKCQHLHSFVCPSYAANGHCNRGSNCTMLHRDSKKHQAVTSRHQSKSRSEKAVRRKKSVSGEEMKQSAPVVEDDNPGTLSASGAGPSSVSENTTSSALSSSLVVSTASGSVQSQPSFISLPISPDTKDKPTHNSETGLPTVEAPRIRPSFLSGNFRNKMSELQAKSKVSVSTKEGSNEKQASEPVKSRGLSLLSEDCIKLSNDASQMQTDSSSALPEEKTVFKLDGTEAKKDLPVSVFSKGIVPLFMSSGSNLKEQPRTNATS